jgi:pSer/pThr/pTyr-binding forkhead associated (FHA) protein
LEDLQSRNGTYVNDARVTRALLRDGDEIRAGSTVFQVAICGGMRVTDTQAEFDAIDADCEFETADEAVEDTSQHVDVDGVFDQLKAKLRRRQ